MPVPVPDFLLPEACLPPPGGNELDPPEPELLDEDFGLDDHGFQFANFKAQLNRPHWYRSGVAVGLGQLQGQLFVLLA